MRDISKERICYICYPYNSSRDTGRGHDRYAYELISRIKRRCANVDVWESKFRNVYGAGGLGTVIDGAVQECIFPFRFSRAKASIFHATSPLGGKTVALLGKRPLVTTIHDVVHLYIKEGYDISAKYRYKNWCIKTAAQKSDIVITTFPSTKRALMERLRIPSDRIEVVTIGLDHSKFFPSPKEPSPAQKILFIGEAACSKGVDTLVRAFSIVSSKISRAELIIGSEGRDLNYLKTLAKDLGLAGKARFAGFVPEERLRSFYCQGDVFVFPSRYGFGLPMLEAMACGIPTIGADTLDSRDYMQDAGILIRAGDHEQLADAIIRILSDGKVKNEYSKKGIERARAFSWEKMAQDTLRVYEKLLG